MIDKELFEMPRDDDDRGPGPVPAIIAVTVAFWLLVVAAGYGLVKLGNWL